MRKGFGVPVLLGALSLAFPEAAAKAADITVPAKVTLVKLDKNDGTAKLARIVNKPVPRGATFEIPTPGGGSDPTVTGGSLRFCKLAEPLAECESIPLPASGWKGLGRTPGSKGYKYKGAGSLADPCKVVIVKPKVIRAVCKGPGAVDAPDPFDLPVGPDGVGFELTLGEDRYCAESSLATGAIVKRDDPAKGIFKAIKANAPDACFAGGATPTPPTPTPTPPYGSASKAFLERGATLLE